ncbi:class I SAM-dependent methyltransferase [candidate division KSB1 bacterium]|nr:class I SAM-dependent methyltransferase [candidate division KSB1 bacterium]NIR69275.1 class I SAM-dependent methyltransferase [candidate division KSB1 bacterium]NIS24136.1 class I SAM-dependent methyltransferase [candidate division KSB1 bacterium]NIT71050.1 class I SAM-dependent methyltransferase [candidate division KSB1 bacterium]NIU24755.1 class I SAM-dependent methyltransferase [candidate division KSB1 bacterium]
MEQVERPLHTRTKTQVDPFPAYACPSCRDALENIGKEAFRCPPEGHRFEKIDGIWRFLLPDRKQKYANFIKEYERIRKAEGRGSDDPTYYQELPFKDLSGRFVEDWRIRTATYLRFVGEVIHPLHKSLGRPVRILDVGAGNGWLSNRLTQLGHLVIGLDLVTNDFDGLRACKHYLDPFELVQAEFDHTPFPNELFDLMVFNASFHYSEGYETTLSEALRVLKKAGHLVILETPVYKDARSGEQMVKEREEAFTKTYGFPSNSLRSENYLTYERLDELARTADLRWHMVKPNYGWKWRLKPIVAKLRRRREPAQFLILVGKRKSS